MSVNAAAVPNGRYFIVNNVTTPYGALSVNYNGDGNPLILASYGTQCGSVWNITRYNDDTYKISPYGAPQYYEVVDVGGVLTTINSSIPQGWHIKKVDGLYTIQDTTCPVFWEVQEAKPGEKVIVGRESSGEGLSGWWLLPGVGCA